MRFFFSTRTPHSACLAAHVDRGLRLSLLIPIAAATMSYAYVSINFCKTYDASGGLDR